MYADRDPGSGVAFGHNNCCFSRSPLHNTYLVVFVNLFSRCRSKQNDSVRNPHRVIFLKFDRTRIKLLMNYLFVRLNPTFMTVLKMIEFHTIGNSRNCHFNSRYTAVIVNTEETIFVSFTHRGKITANFKWPFSA